MFSAHLAYAEMDFSGATPFLQNFLNYIGGISDCSG